MTLSAPVAMSVVGDAKQVRHLRAAGRSWAVWTANDDGAGDVFVVRERTTVISVIGGLRTDGADFSERVIPIPRVKAVNFHCLEVVANEVVFMFSDSVSVFTFVWNIVTNAVTSPVTFLSPGDLPSQFTVSGVPRQFYVSDRDVKVRVGGGPEINIIDPTATEAVNQDVVRKAETFFARYAGTQSINRDLALPMKADANTILLYDGAVDSVSVNEGLPPGIVSYWTFDTGDFSGSSAVDIVGGNNASLVGAAPVSAAGQVGQAREFLGGTGSGHYNAGNPANLRITGQLSLSWWMRINSLQNYHHPISRGYGGEYATIINGDGSAYFYYGTQGGNGYGAPYFGYFLPASTFKAGVWTHVVWTRDFVNKIVRAYVNGRLVLQRPTQGTAAAVSTTGTRIGNDDLWTNSLFSGRLDEVIVANQAWSAQSVAALYAKGLAGNRASVIGLGSALRLLDAGSGARHAVIPIQSLSATKGQTAVGGGDSILVAGGSAPAQSLAFTIEAVVYPLLSATEAVVYSSRAELIHSGSGSRNEGGVELSYTTGGLLRFKFDTSSLTAEFRQESGERLRFNAVNHVAVSHTFGAVGSFLLVINGSPVSGRWVTGSGNEVPSLSAGAPTMSLGAGDQLAVVRVSNVAKTLTQIRDYLRGRL